VVADINTGQMIVNYRGHGSETAWTTWNTASENFNAVDVALINNGAMTPVVFSICCLNNRLDWATDCLGETFTKPADASVAFLGASQPSWTNPNHTYDKQLYGTIFDEGTEHIGNASNTAAVRIILWHDNLGEDNAKMYLWLGDPSLVLPINQHARTYKWLILMDTTGSMRSSSRMDRAKSWARQKVESILEDDNDEIALARFGGSTDFLVLNNWTRDKNALMNSINGCTPSGMTPLADACCDAADKLVLDEPDQLSRRLIILTDGNENYSNGTCQGPDDPDPNPGWCDNTNSWHCQVWNKMVGSMVVDVGFFGGVGAMKDEFVFDDWDILAGKDDEQYFSDLTESTQGQYGGVQSDCGNGILEPWEECDCGYPCHECDQPHAIAPYICDNCQCVPVVTLQEFFGLFTGLESVSYSYGVPILGGPQGTRGDFQDGGTPSLDGWVGVDRSNCNAGNFAQSWTALEDLDPCVANHTPQVAFIDDGIVVPGTGGYTCTSWCYGPAGYIVNPEGGLAGPENHLWNEIWSPPIDWPGGAYDGATLAFDVYSHANLTYDSPGIYVTWHIRTAVDAGDAGLAWTVWRDAQSAYYGGPYTYQVSEDILAGKDDEQYFSSRIFSSPMSSRCRSPSVSSSWAGPKITPEPTGHRDRTSTTSLCRRTRLSARRSPPRSRIWPRIISPPLVPSITAHRATTPSGSTWPRTSSLALS